VAIDVPCEIFLQFMEFRPSGKFPGEKYINYRDSGIPLKYNVRHVERSFPAENQIDPYSRFDTIPACDRRYS